jgi:5'-nucleotidase
LRRSRLSLAAALAVASSAVLVGVPAVAEAAPKPKPDVPVQLIAMNDFHGRISAAPASSSDAKLTDPGKDGQYGTADDTVQIVGGSANVASTVNSLQKSFRGSSGPAGKSYFVGAGDLVSASSFESSVFKDEPTIEVLNAMGLDASSVGNHEFDRGTQELRRLSSPSDGTYTDNVGACDGVTKNVDGCWDDSTGAPFHGTDFPYLAANVVSKKTGEPMLPPYQVFNAGAGRKIALIGVVTDTTPTIVSPNGIADVAFIDEAQAINKWSDLLVKQGIKAIGVVVHEGGSNDGADKLNPNGCAGLSGPVVDINNHVTDQVDFIVSAHSHQAYNCLLPVPNGQPRLVTQAGYYGRLVTDIRLTLNSTSGDVIRSATYRATNVPVARDHADPTVQKIVDSWNARSAVQGNKVVGSISSDITRAYGGFDANGKPVENRGGESSLGNLVAEAQLAAMQQDQYGTPVIAFMNPGGLRTDLTYGASEGGEQPGQITYREVYNVQPFGNTVNAATLTGADIDDVLEQQFQGDPDGTGPLPPAGPRGTQLILGTNAGFTYSYDLSRPYGDRVPDSSITLNGKAIDATATYRVAMNSFLATGGDSFTAFKNGTSQVTGPVDVDTAVSYFGTHSPVSPPPANHATKIG